MKVFKAMAGTFLIVLGIGFFSHAASHPRAKVFNCVVTGIALIVWGATCLKNREKEGVLRKINKMYYRSPLSKYSIPGQLYRKSHPEEFAKKPVEESKEERRRRIREERIKNGTWHEAEVSGEPSVEPSVAPSVEPEVLPPDDKISIDQINKMLYRG